MATATKICKVCGKEYEYCHTVRQVSGVFRYQDVACCPEHGSIYLEKVLASRAEPHESQRKTKKSAKAKESVIASADKPDTKSESD